MKTVISFILILCGVFLVGHKLTEIKTPPISKYEAVNPAWQDPAVYEKQHDIGKLKVELRQILIHQDPSTPEFKIPD